MSKNPRMLHAQKKESNVHPRSKKKTKDPNLTLHPCKVKKTEKMMHNTKENRCTSTSRLAIVAFEPGTLHEELPLLLLLCGEAMSDAASPCRKSSMCRRWGVGCRPSSRTLSPWHKTLQGCWLAGIPYYGLAQTRTAARTQRCGDPTPNATEEARHRA